MNSLNLPLRPGGGQAPYLRNRYNLPAPEAGKLSRYWVWEMTGVLVTSAHPVAGAVMALDCKTRPGEFVGQRTCTFPACLVISSAAGVPVLGLPETYAPWRGMPDANTGEFLG